MIVDMKPEKFKCKKEIMEYLVFKRNLPILSYDDEYFYFANTSELKAALDAMPFYLKLRSTLAAVFLQE